MKKIIRYMQDTALSYSQDAHNSAAYLNARGKEPQQRTSRTRQHHQHHAERRCSYPSAHSHSIPAYTSGARGPFPIPHEVQKFQYGSDNILQSVEVYIPQRSPNLGSLRERSSGEDSNDDSSAPPAYTARDSPPYTPTESPMGTGTHTPTPKYWVIYIHGGYFRDPKVDSSSFHPALGQLCNPHHQDSHVRAVQEHIAGYASINYRLSPHERYPQGEETDKYGRREAKWPEQMADVLAAIKWLQGKYGFGEQYLLVGHSVGATMALLACLQGGGKIETPLAVLGVCGIYDFDALHKTFGSDYEYLTKNAGMTEESWRQASPALRERKEYEENWSKGKKRWCLLAQSKTDGLVDWGQVELMQKVFEGEGSEGVEVLVDVMEVKGKHNEVWERGGELARCVAAGVGEIMGLDQ